MGKTYIADKETLDKCYAILSADGIYGFIEHMDVLSPTARIEYIGQNNIKCQDRMYKKYYIKMYN